VERPRSQERVDPGIRWCREKWQGIFADHAQSDDSSADWRSRFKGLRQIPWAEEAGKLLTGAANFFIPAGNSQFGAGNARAAVGTDLLE
jgi:hypothetical protein